MTPKIKEFAENKYPVSHRTPHAKEFALQQYARREAFEEGILIGAEFAEWVSCNGFVMDKGDIGKWYKANDFPNRHHATIKQYTTPKLLDIFITEKMKDL